MNRDNITGWLFIALMGLGSYWVDARWPEVSRWLGLWFGAMAFLLVIGLANRTTRQASNANRHCGAKHRPVGDPHGARKTW